MTLSYQDLAEENADLRRKLEEAYKTQWEASLKLENYKKEKLAQIEDFKKEVRGIRSEAEKLAIHFSEVKQQRDRLEKELRELRGQMELID